MPEDHDLTIDQICSTLADLAHRLGGEDDASLDPVTRHGLRRAVTELERFIPGLDVPPDLGAARRMIAAAAGALRQGKPRTALGLALRGLSCAPHHAELHYLAASACFELAAASEAVCLLAHAVWINPGHEKAQRELEALSAFGESGEWWSEWESDSGDDAGGIERAA